MDIGLDIRMLTKCFDKKAIKTLDDDSQSLEIILSLADEDLLKQVDLQHLISELRVLRISPTAVTNCEVYVKANSQDKITKYRKLVLYVKSKITILDFMCALLATGQNDLADLLLRRLYQKIQGENTRIIPKETTKVRYDMHRLVRKLKIIVDSKSVADPLKILRGLAIEYKTELQHEDNCLRKQRVSEKYLGVLALEIDTNGFSTNAFKYITVEALLSEFKKVIQFTSCPMLFEGLFYIRLASHYSYYGQGEAAKDMVTQALVVTKNIETCPEVTNIWYETLNVQLLEFEEFPTRENMTKIIQTGYTGIQTASESEFGIYQLWTSSFLIRMAFAYLGIGIRGNIITGFTVREEDIHSAEILLAGVYENGLATRRRMFYCVAMGRLFQLKNEWTKAAVHKQEAKCLAIKLGFEEMKYILGKMAKDDYDL